MTDPSVCTANNTIFILIYFNSITKEQFCSTLALYFNYKMETGDCLFVAIGCYRNSTIEAQCLSSHRTWKRWSWWSIIWGCNCKYVFWPLLLLA